MRRSSMMVRAAQALGFGAAMAAAGSSALAQLPSLGAPAHGLGDNYTALARGVHAPAWNPAGLGLPGSPRFALGFGGALVGALDPIGLGEVASVDGGVLSDETRARWLTSIRDAGRQRMAGTLGSSFALAAGRFAFQFGTELRGRGDLAPDAMELLLFGNAGATGTPRALSFAGTDFAASGVTTLAASYAQPLWSAPATGDGLALGVTVKRMLGMAHIAGRDRGGRASTDPLLVEVVLPIVQSDSAGDDFDGGAGDGWGADVGAAWRAGPWTGAVVVKNVVNTFAWDANEFWWRAGTARFDADTSVTDFDVRRMSSAPDEVRRLVEDERYAPELAVGGAWRVSRRVLVAADARRRLGEGTMNAGPEQHLGAGVELRPFGFLPLRLGAARADEVNRLAAGVGIEAWWLNVALSAAREVGGTASAGVMAFTVVLGGR